MGRSEHALKSWEDLLKKVGLEHDLVQNADLPDDNRRSEESDSAKE